MNFTPLYIKTDNSIFKSLIKVNDLVSYALKYNIKSLAIADENLYGAMDFYMQSIKNNIKPIIGLEIKIEGCVVVLYCENYLGYKNLIKLNSIKSKRDITINDLKIYSSDLICLVPYEYYDLYQKINNYYKYSFRTYKNINEKENIKEESLYMNETLCLNKDDLKYLSYLDYIRKNNKRNYLDNYLHSNEEVAKYNDLNNQKINELCNLEIPLHQDLIPKYENNLDISSYDYLKKKCIAGLKRLFGNRVSKTYQDRLKYELDVINKMNFSNYFLIVADYVNYAKDNNILVGPGRGSAVSSLVSYLLNITEVDPVKNNLLFERFLNLERIGMPDIDIDFEHLKREEVVNYCINKYGQNRVAPIISFGTMGARQTIKEVANVLNVSNYIVDNLTKMLDSNLTILKNLEKKEVRDYVNNNNLKELIHISLKLEGLKHHISIHAAGIVISNTDLEDVIPMINYGNLYITGIDMTYLENIGLLKMDFLAIKYLTIIHNMIDEVNVKNNINLSFSSVPLNDNETLNTFTCGNTLGIFQFESPGMINFLKKLKPTSFEDITLAMALFRPGPMKNIDTFIANKNNPEKIKYMDELVKDILKPTYGILIYQEQIMQIATILAGYTKGEADVLRKAMSKKKKDILKNEEEKFINGCLNNNIDRNKAKQIYDLMFKFAEYGFNKSHSYGYSLISYRMAYIKAHYPYTFYSYLLNEEINDKEKIKKYFKECKKNNIKFLKPNINISDKYFKEQDGAIIYPLCGIKGISIGIANNIIEERKKGNFKSIYDFIKRVNLSNDILSSLIKLSCFDIFNINSRTLMENLDVIINYGELLNDVDTDYNMEPILVQYPDYELKDKLAFEHELLGIYLSNHPTIGYKAKLNNIVDVCNIDLYFDQDINIVVFVDKYKTIMTKKNDKMSFITGSDETDEVDLVMFPKTLNNFNFINENNILLVNGHVEKRFDKLQIIVNKIKKLD